MFVLPPKEAGLRRPVVGGPVREAKRADVERPPTDHA
jgi:hypothetical protein